MGAAYFVQAYKAKGTRLLGQPTERFGFVDEALSSAKRLHRWRAGIVVFRQEVGDDGLQRGHPTVLTVYGTVPDGWLAAERAMA